MGDLVRFEDEIVVRAPQEVVLRGFLDVARYPEWQWMVRRVLRLSGPPDGIGTTYVLDHGPLMKLRVTVLEVRYADHVRLRQQGLGMDQQIKVSFNGFADTTTTVRFEIGIRPPRLFGRTSLKTGSGMAQRGIRRELERFRDWIENDYGRRLGTGVKGTI